MNKVQLRKQLVLHEGLKLSPYKCTAGKWTVGVGRNYQDIGFSQRETIILFGKSTITTAEATEFLKSKPLTKEKAMLLLDNDIASVISRISKRSEYLAVKGDDVRERVLIDLVFNMGITTWSTFKNTIKYIVAKDWVNAARNLEKSKWYTQVGTRGKRIVKMLETGVDSKDFASISVPDNTYSQDK